MDLDRVVPTAADPRLGSDDSEDTGAEVTVGGSEDEATTAGEADATGIAGDWRIKGSADVGDAGCGMGEVESRDGAGVGDGQWRGDVRDVGEAEVARGAQEAEVVVREDRITEES